jgi:exosortase
MSSTPNPAGRPVAIFSLLAFGVLLGSLLWAYWGALTTMAQKWELDPQYSHGYLVPAFAVVLLWCRRSHLANQVLRPSWWGVPVLAVGAALRLAGMYIYLDWLEAISLLPCLAGAFLLVGGWPAFRWAWPAVGFLFFMIPLPYRVEIAMAHPLQRLATVASTYALQTLGFPAVSEGNVILLNEVRMGVVEACSGLSMLVIFFALSTAVALLIHKPWLDRAVIVASAVPIALIANITRITVTGVLHETVGHQVANWVFHDFAGWLMMPFALVLLWLELALLARLFVEEGPSRPLAFGLPVAPAAPAPSRKRRVPQNTK